MIGVEDEEHVQRARQARIGLVAQLGHPVHHREEVAGIVEVVVGVDVGLSPVVAVGERGERRHLCEQPDYLDGAHLLVCHLVGVGVEGRQGADRGDEHAHRVGVIAKALHEVLDVLVNERVNRDLIHPGVQLRAGRQRAVDQQVGHLEVGRVLTQLLDRIAAMLQDAGLAVDVGDRAATRGRVHVGGVVCHQPKVLLVGFDLAQVHRAHGSV